MCKLPNNMSMIKQEVLRLYLDHPFPQWTREEREHRFCAELLRYHCLGLADAMKGARFLDVGCGTGNRSMLAAKRFGVAEYVGFDHSRTSLEIARQVAAEEHFDRFTPVEGDLFALPFDDESFDVVVSWGVLHHTADPLRGFREMVRVCRPGGYIGLFVYNKWNHWRHNMQKDWVSRNAGPDIEERFAVAHRRYGAKPVEEMTPMELAVFYDQYCHPHKSDHTLGEILRWFDDLGLAYSGSYPALRIRDAVSMLKFRSTLSAKYPARSRRNRAILRLLNHLPVDAKPSPPFGAPSLCHRFFWQAVYAWIGRHGQYSSGAAMSARKGGGPAPSE